MVQMQLLRRDSSASEWARTRVRRVWMSGSGAERSGDGSGEATVEDAGGAGACGVAVRPQRRKAATPARTRRCIGLTIQIGMSRARRVVAGLAATVAGAAAKPVNATHAQSAGKSSDQRG